MRYVTPIFLFLLMVGLGRTAQAQKTHPAPGVTCNTDSNLNNGLTHDACVVDTNPGQGDQTVAACKVLQSAEALDLFGFTSYGDCVSNGETVFGPTLSSFGVFALLLVGWVAVQWRKRRKRDLLWQA